MKKIFRLTIAAMCFVLSAYEAEAQTYPDSNQPLGNIIAASDGFIYGSFSKKDNTGALVSSTLYKYHPGDVTFIPIYRSETKELVAQIVDSGVIYGVRTGYTGASPTTSDIFRISTDGAEFTVLATATVSTWGHHSLQVLQNGQLYALRSGGGTHDAGILFRLAANGASYQVLYNFTSPSERPSQLIIHQLDYPSDDPMDLWGPLYSGGAYGKGGLYVFPISGESPWPVSDFTGFGGENNDWNLTNAENPLSIIQGNDVNVYLPTRAGGAYDAGMIFNSSGDGNWITHDFLPEHGRPSTVITIDQYEGKLFGYSGNIDLPNSGMIYYKWPRTDEFSIIGNFNSFPFSVPVDLVAAPDTLLYGTARVSSLDSNGALFSLNPDGTDPTVLFHFVDYGTSSFLVEPSNAATGISASPNIQFQPISGATQYVVQLSLTSDFETIVLTDTINDIRGQLTGLNYLTTYYARVKTNVSTDFGEITSFTTGATDVDSYVIDPASNALLVPINNVTVTANTIPGATQYTVELNTSPDFTGTSLVMSSSTSGQRTFVFNGLSHFTVYHSRVRTNLSASWGPSRSFTTIGADIYITSPANGTTGLPLDVPVEIQKQGASEYYFEITDHTTNRVVVVFYEAEYVTQDLSFHLNASTTYSLRVSADNNPNYGPSVSFTTHAIHNEAYVTDPQDGATGIHTSPVITAHRVYNVTSYTVELNTKANFTGTSFVRTITGLQSEHVFTFSGLSRETKYYSRARTNFSPLWGPTRSFTTHDVEDTYVISPADKSFNASINPLIRLAPVPGATSYTLEFARNPEFTDNLVVKTSSTPEIQLNNLEYFTSYYTRAKSNLSSGYSFETRFTTITAEKYLFVSNPVDGATFVATNNLKVTANAINGASTYTIELSTHPHFLPEYTIQKSSATPGQRTLIFNGLAEATKYYSRVYTNISSTGPTRTFTTIGAMSFLTQPSNNATDVSTYPLMKLKPVTGATEYTLEISSTSDFSRDVIGYTTTSTTVERGNVNLEFTTTYYARVKTNVSPYGQVTKFTTQAINTYAFVSSPVNGATNVAYHNLKVTANEVIGATDYTIELNTSPDFTGTSIVKSSPVYNSRTIVFELIPSTTYYNRMRTNVPTDWGPVRSFTTAPAPPPPLAEADNVVVYPNPFKTNFTIHHQSTENQNLSITLIDVTGRELYNMEITENQLIELGDDLASGLYLLRIKQGSTIKTYRMIKDR